MKFHHRLHFAQCLFIRNFLYIRIYPRRLLYRKNRGHEVLTPCTSRCSCTSRVLLGVGLRRTVSALYRKHRGHEVLTPWTSRCSCTSRILLGVGLRRTVSTLQEALHILWFGILNVYIGRASRMYFNTALHDGMGLSTSWLMASCHDS